LLSVSDSYESYCVDEAIYAFGSAIENELNSLEQRKGESNKAFSRRKQLLFLRYMEVEEKQKFANPIATK
jgi:hypothetical protein